MSKLSGGFFIDGEIVTKSSTGRTVELVSPSTEEVKYTAPEASEVEVDAAIAAARRAFDDGPWPRMSTKERADIIWAACDALEPHAEQAARLQTDEMGAPIALVRQSIRMVIELVREMCESVVSYGEVEARTGQWECEIRTEPYGVVGAISPWNGPFVMTVLKGATALLAGCTIVEKPPIEAPLSSLYFARALAEAGVPAGAFNLVPGSGLVGERLVSSHGVDMVSFSGGTAVGRHVGEICGAQLKRVVLELGGKSPAVVLDDGDLGAAVAAVAASVFGNSGQICSALSRLIVPQSRRDEFVDALVEAAHALTIGDPHDPTIQMGPLATQRHRDRVADHIALAVSEGACLVTGGDRPAELSRGYYLRPAVFADVSNSMRIAQEEVFGPVATVITYNDEAEAIKIANDSPFGLNASVFSADEQRAIGIASQLRVGAVAVNAYTTNFSAPRHHIKGSGLGVRSGREGYEQHRLAKLYNLRPTARAYSAGSIVTQ